MTVTASKKTLNWVISLKDNLKQCLELKCLQ